jgi:hypothetical protein
VLEQPERASSWSKQQERKKQERPKLNRQAEVSPASQAEQMYQQYSQMYLHNNQVPPPKSYQQIYNQQQHNQFQQQQQQQLHQPIQQQHMQQQQMQQGYATGFQHQPHHVQEQYQLQQQRIQEQGYHQMMELNAQFGYAPPPQNMPQQQKQQQQQHNQIQVQPRQQLYNHTTPNYSLPPSIYNQPNSTYEKPSHSRQKERQLNQKSPLEEANQKLRNLEVNSDGHSTTSDSSFEPNNLNYSPFGPKLSLKKPKQRLVSCPNNTIRNFKFLFFFISSGFVLTAMKITKSRELTQM